MLDKELLDPILLSLADDFEANKANTARIVEPLNGEWEALREFLARQRAEELMIYAGTGKPSWAVKLTAKGYTKYLTLINAKRKLG